MAVQTINFGTEQYSTFTAAASGTDYTSNWNVSATILSTEAPLTGSFTNTTGRPVNLTTLRLLWWADANPTTSTVDFQIATAASGSGGVQSAATNANGADTTYTLDWVVDRTIGTVYYGFQKNDSGNVRFSTYSSTGNDIFVNGTVGWADRRETATIVAHTLPDAPGVANLVSATATTITCSWGAVTDVGDDLGVNGYRICIKEASLANGTNNANWRVATLSGQASLGDSGSTTRQATITGLTPGTNYDVRVAALNSVTDLLNPDYSTIAAHTGTRTGVSYMATLSGIYNGTTWVAPTSSVYNGTSWINANTMVYNGTSWVQWGYRP